MTYVQIYKQYVQILKKQISFFFFGGVWRIDNKKFYEEKKKRFLTYMVYIRGSTKNSNLTFNRLRKEKEALHSLLQDNV